MWLKLAYKLCIILCLISLRSLVVSGSVNVLSVVRLGVDAVISGLAARWCCRYELLRGGWFIWTAWDTSWLGCRGGVSRAVRTGPSQCVGEGGGE